MVQRVILHIGSHKTGSTSIQSALKGYDDGAIFYAELGGANHSAPLFSAFSEQKYNYHIWKKQGLSHEQIDQRAQQALTRLHHQLERPDRHSLILSGEDLSLLEPTGVDALLRTLRGPGRDLLVICYVRHPLSYATSVCQQLIKGGGDQLPELFSPAYRQRLEAYRNRLDPQELTVRCFDRQHLHEGCVVADFCRVIGLTSNMLTIRSRNESLPAPAIHALYQLNRSGLLQFGDRLLLQARHHLLQVLKQVFAGDPPLSRDLLHSHTDYDDCDFLQEHFGILFAPTPCLDPPPAATLHQWLDQSDLNAEARLQQWLEHTTGLNGTYHQPGDVLQRVFYLCVHSAMLAVHRDALRSMARKSAAGEVLSPSESQTLRQLARQARPGSPAPPGHPR